MGGVGSIRSHSTNDRRSMKHIDPLTYRHPRTLEEAFPDPVERSYAVFGYRQTGLIVTRWAIRMAALFLAFLLIGYLT